MPSKEEIEAARERIELRGPEQEPVFAPRPHCACCMNTGYIKGTNEYETDTRCPYGCQAPSFGAPAALDPRAPEEKAAGVAKILAWFDDLPEPWRSTYERMKARRVAAATTSAKDAPARDPRVDWSTASRPGVLGGECSGCLHAPPLHNAGCAFLSCVAPEPCACWTCVYGTKDAPATSAPVNVAAETKDAATGQMFGGATAADRERVRSAFANASPAWKEAFARARERDMSALQALDAWPVPEDADR